MPITRNSNLYNMSNNQNPNNLNPEQPNLQQQISQIATVLEQITHRLDVMDERWARKEFRPPNKRGRGPFHEEMLDESERDEDEGQENEDKEFKNCRPQFRHNRRAFPRARGGRGADYQPLDELTKRMKVDVSNFYGKLEPNAFEDWLTTIEDYFDWFAISED